MSVRGVLVACSHLVWNTGLGDMVSNGVHGWLGGREGLFGLLLDVLLDLLVDGLHLVGSQKAGVEALCAERSDWINLLFDGLNLNNR